MNKTDKDTLQNLLRELCSAQDETTHWNEQGPGHERLVSAAQAKRTSVWQRIITFVDVRMPG